jgi:hypothetical protein
MTDRKPPVGLIVAAALALIIAGGLYARDHYQPPEAPPQLIWTKHGAVLLYKNAKPGEVITAPDIDTIYYLAVDGKRVVFPDVQTFNSWYADFTAVKTIPRDVLESYPLSGRNVTIRPGTYLVKIQSTPHVWTVGFPNILFWLADGQTQVTKIYGEKWQDRLVDIPEYYFSNYSESVDLHGTDLLPAGTLIHAASDNHWYLITPEGQRLVTEKGFKENHFQAKFALELEKPLDIAMAKQPLDAYEVRWGSPDLSEQRVDHGVGQPAQKTRAEINVNGAKPEAI